MWLCFHNKRCSAPSTQGDREQGGWGGRGEEGLMGERGGWERSCLWSQRDEVNRVMNGLLCVGKVSGKIIQVEIPWWRHTHTHTHTHTQCERCTLTVCEQLIIHRKVQQITHIVRQQTEGGNCFWMNIKLCFKSRRSRPTFQKFCHTDWQHTHTHTVDFFLMWWDSLSCHYLKLLQRKHVWITRSEQCEVMCLCRCDLHWNTAVSVSEDSTNYNLWLTLHLIHHSKQQLNLFYCNGLQMTHTSVQLLDGNVSMTSQGCWA